MSRGLTVLLGRGHSIGPSRRRAGSRHSMLAHRICSWRCNLPYDPRQYNALRLLVLAADVCTYSDFRRARLAGAATQRGSVGDNDDFVMGSAPARAASSFWQTRSHREWYRGYVQKLASERTPPCLIEAPFPSRQAAPPVLQSPCLRRHRTRRWRPVLLERSPAHPWLDHILG